jgi:hypothetical protein
VNWRHQQHPSLEASWKSTTKARVAHIHHCTPVFKLCGNVWYGGEPTLKPIDFLRISLNAIQWSILFGMSEGYFGPERDRTEVASLTELQTTTTLSFGPCPRCRATNQFSVVFLLFHWGSQRPGPKRDHRKGKSFSTCFFNMICLEILTFVSIFFVDSLWVCLQANRADS